MSQKIIKKVHCHSGNDLTVPGRKIPKGATVPSGICLPETELLQSPFRTEFSIESRSR